MSNLIKQKQVQGLVTDLAAKALDSAVVKKSNNLSDINAASARANLGIYSQSEVNDLVSGAEHARSVATLTARAALTGLKVTDRVFVSNDGDSKWALYLVTAITDGAGSTSTFEKIADEDLFTNAISATAVKTAYESNSNTNAYTDGEKTKVGHISVSQAVNLDTIESDLSSTTTTANSALSTANSAATAASAAQSTANSASTAASAAQTTANGAVSDAAVAQSTADGAVTDAAAAQSTANAASTAASAAQATANGAVSDAATAQSTADTAVTNAATAQSAANSAASAAATAQATADAKEEIFTHVTESFTGVIGAANTPISVGLAHPLANGFTPQVFFNGLIVDNIRYSGGSNSVDYTVPFATDAEDVIMVTYCYN